MADERPDPPPPGAGQWSGGDPVAPPPPPPAREGRPADGQPPPPPGWGSNGRSGPGRPDGLRPMTLADVLDGIFRLLKDHWRAYLLAVGGVLVPLSLLSNILLAVVAPQFIAPDLATLLDPEQIEAGAPLLGTDVVVAGLVAAGVSFLFTTPISWSVCTVVAGAALRREEIEPAAAIRAGLRRWPAVLAVFLVQALAYVAAGAVVVLLTVAAVASVGGAGGLLAIPLLLGWVAFVAWLYTRWALSFPVAVLEEAGALRALRRSWSLTGARFWWLFGTLVLAVVLSTIVGSIASTPLQLVAVAPGLSTFVAAVVVSLGAVVSGLISTPVTVNALTLLYADRRVRREGIDLLADAGDGPPRDADPVRHHTW